MSYCYCYCYYYYFGLLTLDGLISTTRSVDMDVDDVEVSGTFTCSVTGSLFQVQDTYVLVE